MGMWGDYMMYKSFSDLMCRTLNQLAAVKSPDVIDNKRTFAHLLLDIYFDCLDIPDEEIQRKQELEKIFKPMFEAPALAPPPGFYRETQ